MENLTEILNSEFFKTGGGEIVLQAAAGVLISFFTQLSKKLKVPTTLGLLLFSGLVGFGWVAFEQFVPEESKENVVKFAVEGLTFAVTFYQFVLKRFLKNQITEVK